MTKEKNQPQQSEGKQKKIPVEREQPRKKIDRDDQEPFETGESRSGKTSEDFTSENT